MSPLFAKRGVVTGLKEAGINGRLVLQAVKEVAEGCGQLQQALQDVEYAALAGQHPVQLERHKLREAALNFEDAAKMLRDAMPPETPPETPP